MATFVELQDRVAFNIIDLPTTVQNALPALVNSAMRKLQGGKHTFKVQETLLETTTDLTNSPIDLLEAALPSNFKEWLGRPYWVPYIGGKARKLSIVSRRRATELYGNDSAVQIGSPKVVFEGEPTDTGARSLYVRPFPDGASDWSDGEYRIKFPYIRYLPDLSADADTNWLTVNADRYIEAEATYQAFFRDHDEERAAVWKSIANDEYNEVVKVDKRYRLSAAPTWELSVNAE